MPRLDAQDASAIATCEWCRGEIYAGDEVMRVDDGGGFVHAGFRQDCAAKLAMERVYDRAGIIGADHEVN
jgi:hypothetical protein